MIALCLCGTFKYGEVKAPTEDDPERGMDLAQQCVAICRNYIGDKDEQQAITDALFPPIERFDATTSGVEEGFIAMWQRMDLSTLFGFPLWEEKVFNVLFSARHELKSIFSQYAKSTAGGGNEGAATMQQQELVDLALDCSLASEAFPMERVIEVFESADAVKDAKAIAKGAKADGALELYEFNEAIVKLAFERENPTFASSGTVAVPLPGCLETVLKDHLLLSAKRDALAEVVRKLGTDAATVQVLAGRREALMGRFDKLVKSDASAAKNKGPPAVSMERFCQEMYERRPQTLLSPPHPCPLLTVADAVAGSLADALGDALAVDVADAWAADVAGTSSAS
jgi:hypothetical protein